MSLLRQLQRPREERTANLEALLLAQRGIGPTYAGPVVTNDQALRLQAVWACVRLKANLISTLPLDGYRKVEGRRVELDPQPALITSPSAIVDRISWIYQVSMSLDLRGNAFGVIFARDGRGWPTQIEIFHPDDVSVRLTGRPAIPEYFFAGKPVPLEDVFHLAENVMGGSPIGLSPIEYARQGIGLGLAAEEFGARFFGDGAHPTGVLTSEQEVSKDQAATIKRRFMDATAGAREPAVLGLGIKYAPIQINPEESQFLETTQMGRTGIASIFDVPPEFVGGSSGDSMTYATVESRYQNLLTLALAPRMIRIEKALTDQMPRPQYAKFNEHGLLRTDLKTQHDIVVGDIRGGILSPDEGRALFDREPIPDGEGAQFVWPPFAVKPDAATGDTFTDPTGAPAV